MRRGIWRIMIGLAFRRQMREEAKVRAHERAEAAKDRNSSDSSINSETANAANPNVIDDRSGIFHPGAN